MRLFNVALGLAAAALVAGGAWADASNPAPAGANPLLATAVIQPNVALAAGILGIRPAAPQGVDGLVRLAQAPTTNANPSFSGNPAVAPLKWVGLLVNPTPTPESPNLSETCTGQFVKPNIILTAAHCIKNLPDNPNGPWYDLSKQYFILQYQNGEGSQTFKTVCAATSPLWKLPADFTKLPAAERDMVMLSTYEHDMALILVDGESPTGVMPYELDWKGKRSAASRVGYTTDILDDRIIQVAPGIVFFADSIPMYPKSFPDIVIHWEPVTDLTYGSSGGGWIANPSSTPGPGKNVLIAVSSFSNKQYPGGEGAAYLKSDEFNPLMAFVSNGCK